MKQQNRTSGRPDEKQSGKQRPFKDSVGKPDTRKKYDSGDKPDESEGKTRFNKSKPSYNKPDRDQTERRFQAGDTDKRKRYNDGGKPDESEGKPRFNKSRPVYNKSGRDQAERRFQAGDIDKGKRYNDGGKPDESEGKPRFSKTKPAFNKPGRGQAERRFQDRDTDKRKRYNDGGKPDESEGKPRFSKTKPAYNRPGGDQAERRFQHRDTDKRKKYNDSTADESEERPRFNKTKPAYNKPGKDQAERRFQTSDQKPGFKKDTRPFRERTTPAAAKPEQPAAPTFGDVVKKAFNQPKKNKDVVQREQFEDKVYGELKEDVNNAPPPRPYEVSKKFAPNKEKSGSTKLRTTTEGKDKKEEPATADMPLNKYIAHSGECSRRDAGELVKQGKVKVNGELVLDPGYRVKRDDSVTMSGKKLTPQRDNVYILLNKPKGFITTNDDPQGRRTVMQLVENSGVDRLFPVGRLDRDTTGLLLITNDGDLTQKLSHPSYQIKKVYHVTLDKPLTKADFEKVIAGVQLDDGKAEVDTMAYLEQKNELGLEIHSGRNRIVRRIFESLGYVVEKLDRVMYAGLTKKNLPRSKWRFLEPREVILLKHFKS